jgi:hypothetical protein
MRFPIGFGSTVSAEPTRAKERTDRLEPKVCALTIETSEPTRQKEPTEMPLPTRTNERRLTLLAMWANSKALTDLPSLANDRKLKALAQWTKSNTDMRCEFFTSPTRDREELARTKERKLKLLPMHASVMTLSVEPNRPKLRKLMELEHFTDSITDKVATEPSRKILITDKEEPHRTKLLKDRELLNDAAPKALMAEPERKKERTDNELPISVAPSALIDEPYCTKERTDMEEPKLDIPIIEILSAMRAKLRTLKLEASSVVFTTETM